MFPFDRSKKDNEQRFQTIFETVMEGIITIDSFGVIIDVNPATEQIFQYGSSELVGKNVAVLMPEPYHSGHDDYINNYMRTNDPKIIGKGRQVKGVRKNGEVFDMHLAVSSMKLDNGSYFVGCIRDISAQAKAEHNLQISQERFEISQRFGEIGTWDWDIKHKTVHWSEKVYDLLGYSKDNTEDKFQFIQNRIHPDDQARKKQSLQKCLETGETHDIDYRVVYSDGTIKWVNEKGNVLKGEDGEVYRMLGIIQDVTSSHEYEQSLKNLTDEAIQANLAKTEFLSNMSHELRTPLNAILGFAQLMGISKSNPLNDRQTQQVDQIVEAGNHLLNLINEVLDLSSIEAGHVEFDMQKILIQEIIDECSSLMQPLVRQMEINFKASSDLHYFINADAKRLKQVIINLLSNAIKYNRPKGRVDLVAEKENETILLKVSDTGQGIPEERLEHIFLPFNRLGQENGSITGSGIGLPLTKKIIEEMGGEIGFDSKEGVGSTFWVRLKLID